MCACAWSGDSAASVVRVLRTGIRELLEHPHEERVYAAVVVAGLGSFFQELRPYRLVAFIVAGQGVDQVLALDGFLIEHEAPNRVNVADGAEFMSPAILEQPVPSPRKSRWEE